MSRSASKQFDIAVPEKQRQERRESFRCAIISIIDRDSIAGRGDIARWPAGKPINQVSQNTRNRRQANMVNGPGHYRIRIVSEIPCNLIGTRSGGSRHGAGARIILKK